MSEYEEDAMARLIFYYIRWGLTGNKNILRCMLGREPMSVEDYIVRSLNAWTNIDTDILVRPYTCLFGIRKKSFVFSTEYNELSQFSNSTKLVLKNNNISFIG
jgi:hypothetical protein